MYASKLLLFGSLLLNGEQKCLETIAQNPVVVLQSSPECFRNFDFRKADSYLVTVDVEDLKSVLQRWSSVEFFNPRARFWFLTNTTEP
jgi:hypothetical protein